MTLKKRTTAAVTLTASQILPTLGLGAKYARIVEIVARNWASSAKAAGGTDALMKIQIVDARGVVVYLDAADRDYKTATVTLIPAEDDTATGLTSLKVDSTGAVRAAAEATTGIIAQGPVVITALNGATVTDYFEVSLTVEV